MIKTNFKVIWTVNKHVYTQNDRGIPVEETVHMPDGSFERLEDAIEHVKTAVPIGLDFDGTHWVLDDSDGYIKSFGAGIEKLIVYRQYKNERLYTKLFFYDIKPDTLYLAEES